MFVKGFGVWVINLKFQVIINSGSLLNQGSLLQREIILRKWPTLLTLKPINGNQTLSINYLMILGPNKSSACQAQEYLTPWTRSFGLSQCMVGTRSVKARRS
jgi:hypothetical protein